MQPSQRALDAPLIPIQPAPTAPSVTTPHPADVPRPIDGSHQMHQQPNVPQQPGQQSDTPLTSNPIQQGQTSEGQHAQPQSAQRGSSTERIIDAEIQELQPLLDRLAPGLLANMRDILRLLHETQSKTDAAKLHVFLESDTSIDGANMTELRIMFSPTLIPSNQRCSQLILRAAGLLGLVSRSHCIRNASTQQQGQGMNAAGAIPPDNRLPHPEQLLLARPFYDTRDLRLFNLSEIPSWFPGTVRVHDASNVIHVKLLTFEKFNLPDMVIAWMYEFFFTQANFAASRKFPYLKFKSVYTQFTPNWYKGFFKVSDTLCYNMGVTQVSQRRKLK